MKRNQNFSTQNERMMYSISSSAFFRYLFVFTSLLLLMLPLQGCAGRNNLKPASIELQLAEEQLIARLGSRCQKLESRTIKNVLESTKKRVSSGSSYLHHLKDSDIRVFDCPELFSLVTPTGTIILSKAILRALPSEGALAFLIAHELSHVALHHHETTTLRSRDHYREEIQADKYALLAVIAAHYDPRAAIKVFSQPQLLSHFASANSSHPELSARLQKMRVLIRSSGWRPPGTTSSRKFKHLQAELQ